jgi:hypothetical protein
VPKNPPKTKTKSPQVTKPLSQTGPINKRKKVLNNQATTTVLTTATATGRRRRHLARASLDAAALKNQAVWRARRGRVLKRNLTDTAVKRYVAASGRSAKIKASEVMGESGAREYYRHVTGNAALDLVSASEDVPFALACTVGTPWPHAVAFNGANVVDTMYWDGTSLHAVEAKGGNSKLKPALPSGRVQWYETESGAEVSMEIRKSASPPRVAQGTMAYLLDIARDMADSAHPDGRALAGEALFRAITVGNIEYIAVNTKVEKGESTATVTIMDPN